MQTLPTPPLRAHMCISAQQSLCIIHSLYHFLSTDLKHVHLLLGLCTFVHSCTVTPAHKIDWAFLFPRAWNKCTYFWACAPLCLPAQLCRRINFIVPFSFHKLETSAPTFGPVHLCAVLHSYTCVLYTYCTLLFPRAWNRCTYFWACAPLCIPAQLRLRIRLIEPSFFHELETGAPALEPAHFCVRIHCHPECSPLRRRSVCCNHKDGTTKATAAAAAAAWRAFQSCSWYCSTHGGG